jgi:hypothetical protein
MNQDELLADCLKRLNRCAVPYMVTGSMASNYWGIPRTTHDLDFVIQLDAPSIDTLVREFSGDYFIQPASVAAALKPPYQFNAIDTRSALKVDFWTLRDEPFERQMFARRRSVGLFGQPAFIATAEDVLLHKLVWNKMTPSDRQLGDAAGIWTMQQPVLDLPYLERWATELGVSDRLGAIVRGEIRPKQT